MSGGYWNYDQNRLRDFGETLEADEDATLAATGKHLVAIADVLHAIDWIRSGDTSSERLSDHIAALQGMIGAGYVRDEKLVKALKAIAELGQ